MKLADQLAFALHVLLVERRRSGLALLGTGIGVTAVLIMVALGEGALRLVRSQFDSLGPDVLAVLPGKSETTGAFPGLVGMPRDLTLADARALGRTVDSLARVAPIVFGTDTLAVGQRTRQVFVLGTTPELYDIRGLEVRTGSFLPESAWERPSPVVVLGAGLVEQLFPGDDPLEQWVRVGAMRLRVIGVLRAQGTHFGVDLDEIAITPVTTAMRLFDLSSLARIALEVRPGHDLSRTEERCREALIERHGVEDFTLTTPDAVLEALEEILLVLTLSLAAIASISLLVAGLGIMNVMLVSVSERTEEVGLLRALGATAGVVARLFLLEAALLSTSGGLIGLATGMLVVRTGARMFPLLPVAIPAWAAWAAMLVALGTGLFFGLLPALRAVRLEPVAALTGRAS